MHGAGGRCVEGEEYSRKKYCAIGKESFLQLKGWAEAQPSYYTARRGLRRGGVGLFGAARVEQGEF